jgi:hypothetical protein
MSDEYKPCDWCGLPFMHNPEYPAPAPLCACSIFEQTRTEAKLYAIRLIVREELGRYFSGIAKDSNE